MTPEEEESFQQSTILWLCKNPLGRIQFEITIILQASTEEQLTTGVI